MPVQCTASIASAQCVQLTKLFVLDNAFNMQKLEKELEEALKKLDDEREQAEQQIRAQAETVADDIVAQILPESSKVKKGQKTAA